MNKTSKTSNDETPRSPLAKKQSMEEWCKERGVPFKDETEKYVGQSSVFFFTPPMEPTAERNEGEETGDENAGSGEQADDV